MSAAPLTVVLLALAGLACAGGCTALAVLRRRLELMARAEHELRGPATALALACERMRRQPGLAAHARVMEAQLDRLRAGLDDLAAARTGKRASPRRPVPLDLAHATRAALAPWELEAPANAFAWLGPPAAAAVDRGDLAKTLGNLVANAAEHGDGDVRVRGRSTRDAVRIEIRNRNGGARDARATGPFGRGRGLRIAEQAARSMGGRLLVDMGETETVAVLELPRLRDGGGDEDVAA